MELDYFMEIEDYIKLDDITKILIKNFDQQVNELERKLAIILKDMILPPNGQVHYHLYRHTRQSKDQRIFCR